MSPVAILASELPERSDAAWRAIDQNYLVDETEHVHRLLALAATDETTRAQVQALALGLVEQVRKVGRDEGAVEHFMREYDLSSDEGVLLMCVAEALLRIPDAETADALIRDKLGDANWQSHVGKSESTFVNAGTWGLLLTGRIVKLADDTVRNFGGALRRLVARSGEPVIRLAVRQAMKIMGHQFVMGRTIAEALKRSHDKDSRRYRHSFDMLGEAALTDSDALRYLRAYRDAIGAIGADHADADIHAAPSISVKLSALHPRFELAKRERVLVELTPRLHELALAARALRIGLTVDAEEADRLSLGLELFEQVYASRELDGWEGLGLAVQAYQKRAPAVIDWLAELHGRVGRRIPLRLVKGAYWDSEIKRGQVDGLAGYPVFTRKAATDVSYLACARRLLAQREKFYPMFATHNAQTIAAVTAYAGDGSGYEFQRLHGMGQALYEAVLADGRFVSACRVYAPVGSHEDLLPYLVRRLLENGANTSFVNRISDPQVPATELVADPVSTLAAIEPKAHPRIPLPRNLYGSERLNSRGLNFGSTLELRALAEELQQQPTASLLAQPRVPGRSATGTTLAIRNPADRTHVVGSVQYASADDVKAALALASAAQPGWNARGAEDRARMLERCADLLDEKRARLITLLVREAGKTLADAIAEIREAQDFCRYYAQKARSRFGIATTLPGPTGESNQLSLHGRGVFVCISPWNFPLAIFLGQVAAALVAGNCVIAKPAEQTPLVADLAIALLHEAGVPADVLLCLPGEGSEIGPLLTSDARVAGVAFTGSTETARAINRSLAGRDGPIATLIAETGGQNVLIADSSALPEQVVKDALQSAFGSAGQRCSACRVLMVQEDVADRILKLLTGALAELRLGNPAYWSTDIGPVIDEQARAVLEAHCARMDQQARLVAQLPVPAELTNGCFFAPRVYEIASLAVLEREVFGPVLHVLRFKARELEARLDEINALGYGLTLGVHSRIDRTIERITRRIRAGNQYVNRNMIGAVVGVQPFGGEGLSGTGPKAGGPHYLERFATERVLTINTAAVGGNATLLTQAG